MSDPAQDAALLAAAEAARDWLDSLPDRPVRPDASAREMLAAFSEPLPEEGADPAAVVRDLARRAGPGLMGSGSGRFFGWVIGGALPAAIAADWLVSAWDQNSAMSEPFPATTMIEQVVAGWVLDLLDLPREASVGFVTGGQMANTVCLAAARHHVLAAHGWDVEPDGLQGAPRVSVLVGEQRHDSIDASLRAIGLGASTALVVAADEAGRMRPDALAATAARVSGPTIVCLQAGNVNGGGVDPVGEIAEAVRRDDLWVHVDGAFGLWARAAPPYRHLAAGVDRADSWATDAHKWLNTPYDCGMAICAHPAAHRRAMGVRGGLPAGRRRRGAARPDRLQPRALAARPVGPCLGGAAAARAWRRGRPGGALLPDGRAVRRPAGRGRRRRGAAAGAQPGGREVPRPGGRRPRRPHAGRRGADAGRGHLLPEWDGMARRRAACACR